ncbi:MAG: gamma carbonic anhydrase family protein, partial [Acidimicrobiales bacterium]
MIYALGDQVPDIHPDAYVHPDAVVIGSVHLGSESSVWPTAVLRADDGEIIIGERCSIQDGSVLHTTPMWPTTLGNEVTV